MQAAAALARVEVLRTQVTAHKRTIAEEKRQLHAKASELAELEAHLARLGLGARRVPQHQQP